MKKWSEEKKSEVVRLNDPFDFASTHFAQRIYITNVRTSTEETEMNIYNQFADFTNPNKMIMW